MLAAATTAAHASSADFPILTALILTPLLGAVLALLMPSRRPEYARIVGYLASCQPSSGPVQFVVIKKAELMDSAGRIVQKADELTLCPNVLTSIALDEGPRGRDLK